MKVKRLRSDLVDYLKRRNLVRRYEKQTRIFEANTHHPSLNTEILEPRNLRLYSFRLTQKYRVIFIYLGGDEVEVVDINDHYR